MFRTFFVRSCCLITHTQIAVRVLVIVLLPLEFRPLHDAIGGFIFIEQYFYEQKLKILILWLFRKVKVVNSFCEFLEAFGFLNAKLFNLHFLFVLTDFLEIIYHVCLQVLCEYKFSFV